MSATVMTAKALGASPHDGERAACGLCGALEPARPAAKVLKDTFTNLDELHSDRVCWACEACLADRRTRSAFVVSAGGFAPLKIPDAWETVLFPPEPPFVLFLSHSFQKHGVFRQRVAQSRDFWRVQCEQLSADFSRRRDEAWMRAALELYLRGCSRESILSGRYDSGDYQRTGIVHIRGLDALAQLARGTTLFGIMVPIIPNKEVAVELAKRLGIAIEPKR